MFYKNSPHAPDKRMFKVINEGTCTTLIDSVLATLLLPLNFAQHDC